MVRELLPDGFAEGSVVETAVTGPPPGYTPAAQIRSPRMQENVNRFGGDYLSDPLASAELCQALCDAEAPCRAWTWVKPGAPGGKGTCWLKKTVPPASKNDCCTSGVKN